MKKVLLMGFVIFCIFQMMVMATAIDIGSPATNRVGTRTQGYTVIDKHNPANASGTITTVKIWANTELTGCEVATFTEGTSDTFSTRDWETVDNGNGAGVVLAGSEQTFTVDLDVVVGDYIGLWWDSGSVEKDGSGSGYWKQYPDHIPCTDVAFDADANAQVSFGGTGATAGWSHKWNTLTIGKWNSKTFSKWNGM